MARLKKRIDKFFGDADLVTSQIVADIINRSESAVRKRATSHAIGQRIVGHARSYTAFDRNDVMALADLIRDVPGVVPTED